MSTPTASRHHSDWLSLVEISGPFVSLPVLLRVFSQGLEPRDPTQAKALRAAYEEWQDNPAAPGQQRAWVLHVLTSVLGYLANQVVEGQALPAGLEAKMPEMSETLRPDFALIGPAGTDTSGKAQLLISSYPAEQRLDRPVIGKHWKATPATRMMELLHGAGVPLGLVTNGEQWMLVYAPRGEITGYASWFGALWLDEPITLRAFHTLLGVRRFFGVADDSTLLALLKESANDQQEVTDQLGFQVREAVEVLVQSFDAIDKDSNRVLLKGVSPTSQYEAALTIMMRLVFLFSAEERGLLHLGKPLYDNNYAVSTLQEQLQEVADLYGEEVLERRTDAWARLLSSFRAVHGGVKHQDLLMQAYGGSLFDPDRYPFLEGRAAGSLWRQTAAEPLSVNNRVVLHLLNSLQRLRIKSSGGGAAETRRISFRALGVEQIGHVYEGLLDHTCVRATETVLGIKGGRSKAPEIPLAVLEALLSQGQAKLIDFLKDSTGRSISALRKTLDENSLLDEHKLLVACGHNHVLLARLRPFAGLIREDSFERPVVVFDGCVYVTSGTARRSTGTHYTPPSLTEPIVQHTLESLVYEGPAEGAPKVQWKLKSPKAILEVKVCDIAMGSGAFLVQACRYLAERLTEAWETVEQKYPGQVRITPDGNISEGLPSERLVPTDPIERIAIARRVVADRCLYGVDINPMAVEMAKLSIWLITVDASRPFTFLDHALKCGDSLLGVTSLKQLENFSLRADSGKVQGFNVPDLTLHINEAREKRKSLEVILTESSTIATKEALHAEAEAAVAKLEAAADVLVAVELEMLKGRAYEIGREAIAQELMPYLANGLEDLQLYARRKVNGRRCFHWALAFPEVIQAGGFHAFIGNPPFIGGQKIRGALGADYRDYLIDHLAHGKKGSADLCAYFFLQAGSLLRNEGMAGLLATNTIAQGDTREVGLDQLIAEGCDITRALPSAPWPGVAALEVAHVWLRKGRWAGTFFLSDQPVSGISSLLTIPGRVQGKPYQLKVNESKAFIGTYVLGMGFVLSPEEATSLIKLNPRNRDCLFPYLNGEDLNSRYDQSPSRWVINFYDWPLNRLGVGHWLNASEDQQKNWLQSGSVPSDYPNSVASDYPDLLSIVTERVKPERDKLGNTPDAKRVKKTWWQFARQTNAMRLAISDLGVEVLSLCRVTKFLTPTVVKSDWICSIETAIFAMPTMLGLSLLQNSIYELWVREFTSTLETRLRFSPTDCFETFPFPAFSAELEAIGNNYYLQRQAIAMSRHEGLTKIYNRFHNPLEASSDIAELRRLHTDMDQAVASAYGWQNLELDHGFHQTKQGIRYTISEAARREVLDRLLTLNHQRHAKEQAEKASMPISALAKRGRKPKTTDEQITLDL